MLELLQKFDGVMMGRTKAAAKITRKAMKDPRDIFAIELTGFYNNAC